MKNVFNIKSILLSLVSGAVVFLSTSLAPIFLGFCGAAYGPVCMGIGIVAAFGSTALISGIETAIYMLVMLVPPSIILAYMLKGKCAYRTAAIACTAAGILGIYITLFMPYFIIGYDLEAAVDAYFAPMISQYETAMIPPELATTVETLANTMLSQSMEIVFAMIVIMGIAIGFFQVVLAYVLFGKKLVVKKMAPFKSWQLPTSFLWGSLAMFAVAVIFAELNITYAMALAVVVELIIICPLILIGLCCAEYFIQIVPEGKGTRRIFVYGMAVLGFPASIMIFAVLGIADKLFKLRKRVVIIKKP